MVGPTGKGGGGDRECIFFLIKCHIHFKRYLARRLRKEDFKQEHYRQNIITLTAFEFHFHAHPIMPLSRSNSNKPCVETGGLGLSKHRVTICIKGLLKGNKNKFRLSQFVVFALVFCPAKIFFLIVCRKLMEGILISF